HVSEPGGAGRRDQGGDGGRRPVQGDGGAAPSRPQHRPGDRLPPARFPQPAARDRRRPGRPAPRRPRRDPRRPRRPGRRAPRGPAQRGPDGGGARPVPVLRDVQHHRPRDGAGGPRAARIRAPGDHSMTRITIPEGSLFGRDNLPYCVFSAPGTSPRVGVRVADTVVDLTVVDDVFAAPSLNPFMAQGHARWVEVRERIRDLVSGDIPDDAVHALEAVTLHMPFEVADYVDFYASEHHASNLGRLFRPGAEPLMPNWKHLPDGYHGRAGTVVPSGTDIVRPTGQRKDDDAPAFGGSRRLDIEAEVGFVVGVGSPLGTPVTTEEFPEHVFGVVLVNDW